MTKAWAVAALTVLSCVSGVAQHFPGAATAAATAADVPSCKKYTKTFSDLTTASTTEDEVMFNLPARGKLTGVTIKHTTAFTGGALSAFTVSVGDSSGDTFYTATFDIFIAPTDLLFLDTPMHSSSTFAARDVFAHFISTGANVDAATAGSVDLIACWVVLP